MKNDALGDRMKGYENVNRNYLMRRTPVIIRLQPDGKAFHTFTRGFKKPFDNVFSNAMQDTMKYLCENIQGCVLGYTQSDEITLVLVDYQKLTTSAWFDYNIQKCVSVAASMATLAFNRAFSDRLSHWFVRFANFPDDSQYLEAYDAANKRGGLFDARVFNVPKEEVCNCILWRQNDATRNSIESVGQFYIGHSKMIGLNCNQVQDKLFTEYGVNWNDYPTKYKRGSCCIRETTDNERSAWIIDEEIPVFKGDGRKYIDDLIYIGE